MVSLWSRQLMEYLNNSTDYIKFRGIDSLNTSKCTTKHEVSSVGYEISQSGVEVGKSVPLLQFRNFTNMDLQLV